MNRRNFIKLISGIAVATIIPNIPFGNRKPKTTITGTDGKEYKCVAVHRGGENPIFRGQYVQWDGVIIHTNN